jgi:hypothetical protein
VNPGVKIYAPKEGFGVYGTDLPGTSNLVEPAKTISVASSLNLSDVPVAAITTFEKPTEKKSA